MDGTNFYFRVTSNMYGEPLFEIVSKRYWNKHQCIEDRELGNLGGLLNDNWCEEQESLFCYWNPKTGDVYSETEGSKYLLAMGMTQLPRRE